jgi:peroxiredoxin
MATANEVASPDATYPERVWRGIIAPFIFDDMTTLVDPLPFAGRARLAAGHTFAARELVTLAGGTVRIPDPGKLVHLQMRRYAGCPICSLHLRSFVRRKEELVRAGVREVAVFHSSAEALRRVHTELPFDVVPDPKRQLYAALGVTTSPLALLHPRGLRGALRGVLSRASAVPSAGVGDGPFGLPADFLVAPNGRIIAVKYGAHADDQWSVDELLSLVTGPAASEERP